MKLLLRSVLGSRVTLLVLILCIVLLSTVQQGLFPGSAWKMQAKYTEGPHSVASTGGNLHELVLRASQRTDLSARSAVKARRQHEAEESAMAKRSVGQNDGGDSDNGVAPSTTQNIHVHIVAVGDSLTEGVLRAKEATTKLLMSPYVDSTKRSLMEKQQISGGDRIVSVTTQTFGFRGKSAAGVLYEASQRMFASESDRRNLIPSAIPADLRHVFLNHQDSDTGKEVVHRVVMICSVLGGTNDILRTKGSTVAPTLPTIDPEDTMSSLLKLHHLCADYARAMAKRTVAFDAPLNVQVLLLPIRLPPAMIDPSSVVHRRLVASLEGKRNSLRATYGYCTTLEPSWKAMLEHHRVVNDFITSPGRFIEGLERLAQTLRIEDGGNAVGEGDKAFAPELARSSSMHPQGPQSGVPTRKPIVTVVSKEAVQLDEAALPDDLGLWTDCLHLSVKGYYTMGQRVATVILQQL